MPSLRPAVLPVGTALAGAALTALGFITAGGSTATAQFGQVSELRTERLTLVDQDGGTRAVLGEVTVGELQGTGLVVYERDGQTPRVALGVTSAGAAGMQVHDRSGAVRLQLATGPLGDDPDAVAIVGRDAQGTTRFELFLATTPNGAGSAQVRVADAAGHVRGTLAAFPDGGAAVDLLSGDPHRLRARVGVPPSGEPEVVLFDDAGTVRWRVP